jgi:type I restriction enzyme S subunit
MAQRARLSAPRFEPQQEWPWHQVKWSSLPVNHFCSGDRRMEAENYLSSGYGLRLTIESRPVGWQPFVEYANVWQPSRLKGIQVSSDFGTPFLAATQMFDIRPVPRKWLAVERTNDAANRFINAGTIVVTCSGAVGRATLAHAPHERTLISHDLLRVDVRDQSQWGWIYAYLRSPQARAMMTSARYGHIIKHLETSHLDAMPVPILNNERASKFNTQTATILDLRNRAYRLTLEAEERFESKLGSFKVQNWGEGGFEICSAEALFTGRRRFEGSFHNPGVAAIRSHLAKQGQGFTKIYDAGYDVWVPGRYKRVPAEDGVDYYDSADLLEVCPVPTKHFADCDFGDEYRGRVKSGWLLVPCSGQVYGIIGSIVMGGTSLDGQVVSNHVMRLAARSDVIMRAGYLLTALSHPKLGRPLVKALPFGSSVPEIDPAEFATLEVVRLSGKEEDAIADLAEESAILRAQADEKERALSAAAGDLIDCFLAGDLENFVTTPFATVRTPSVL